MEYKIEEKEAFKVIGLKNHFKYEIAVGYNSEMYSNPDDYKNGMEDEKYYCEIWIPVKKVKI